MKLLKIVIMTCGILTIQGCGVSWLVNPKEQPIIEDRLGSSGFRTLATTPERRVVIFNKDKKLFCAEPPADVADNIASTFAAALEGTEGNITAKVEISKAFASTAKQLFQRSQGVQLYRDGKYSLCQDFINGAISEKEFSLRSAALLTESSKLIEKEIPYLPYLTADDVPAPTAPIPPKLGKAADEVQPAKAIGSDGGVTK